MREKLPCACCRQDKKKVDQEPGGRTYLDMSTGETVVLAGKNFPQLLSFTKQFCF